MASLFALPDPAPRYDDEPAPAKPGDVVAHADPVGDHPDRQGAVAAAPPPGARRTHEPAGMAAPLSDGEAGDMTGGRGQAMAAEAKPGHDESRHPQQGRGGEPEKPALRGRHAPPSWPNVFAQVLAETLAGSRPARQLSPWTTERARGHIRRLGPLLRASGGSPDRGPDAAGVNGRRPATGQEPRIRRVVASMPSMGVVEMAVVVGFGPRVRALAVRLEHPEGKEWLCTAIEAA